jgi:hypothetical protein
MIRKSVKRFSLATNAERVCAEIMLKQQLVADDALLDGVLGDEAVAAIVAGPEIADHVV